MPVSFNKKSTKRVVDARWNLMSRGDTDERVNVFFFSAIIYISPTSHVHIIRKCISPTKPTVAILFRTYADQ